MDWWGAVEESLRTSGLQPQEEVGGAVVLRNEGQHINVRLGPEGWATVESDGPSAVLGPSPTPATSRLRLLRWGRPGSMIEVDPGETRIGGCVEDGGVDVEGDCLREVDRDCGNDLREWWRNETRGIEHGFTVGDGAIEIDDALEIEIQTDRRVEIDQDGLGATLRNGTVAWRYEGLLAWDALGAALPARMKGTEQGLLIHVELLGARWPVTVDPLLTTVGWMADGGQGGAQLGRAVDAAGDVNGDGFGDLVVGAYNHGNGESQEGRAYVFAGSPSGLATDPIWTAEGQQIDARFGRSVAGAGDINGDGFGDIAIGATGYDNGETDEGRAFLFLGSATGPEAVASWTAEGDVPSAAFGLPVASAGDLNGDGLSDLVVGSIGVDNGYNDEGRASVYLAGLSGLPAVASWAVEGDQTGAFTGFSAGRAGDTNGDGYGDLIVGEVLYDNTEFDEGRARVFFGSASGPSSTAAWSVESNQVGGQTGNAVATAGDVNGDGYADVLVGAYAYDAGQQDEGIVSLYVGSPSGPANTASWIGQGEQISALFGHSTKTAGDVNGDGYADVVVGADHDDNGQTDEGRAFVYLGSSSGLGPSAVWTAESDQPGASFGLETASAGDVNGDGYGDLVVAAPYYDNGDTDESADEGAVFLYYGAPSPPSLGPTWTQESHQSASGYGAIVSDAGDVNGDGFDDVLVGAALFDNGQTNEGRVFGYFGSASGLLTVASWTVESNQASSYFGDSIARAGDVNGDGYGDVLVGAFFYDNGSIDEGAAFGYYGSPSGLATSPSWMVDGGPSVCCFANSLASSGDVNGDGYDDVVVGSEYASNGQTAEGRIFVHLGSATGLSAVASASLESNVPYAYLGSYLATGGDLNGDGYGDLLAGMPYWDNPSNDEGAVWAYFGSPLGLSPSPSWMVESNETGAYMGPALTSAGDVNGDGYGDLLISAPELDNGSPNEGRVLLYLGGGSGPSSVAAWTVEGNQAEAHLGYALSGAGDVNGDGFADLVIGGANYDNGEVDEGKVWLYLGSASGPGTLAAWSVEGGATDAGLGVSVAGGSDTNGDGYSDLLVGQAEWSNGQPNEGRVLLYEGNSGDVRPVGGYPALSLRRPGSPIPIVPGLRSPSASAFDVAGVLRSPMGRSRVKWQIEVEPLGLPFDGVDFTTGPTWVDSGLGGVAVTEPITGLVSDTAYHVRGRVLYDPADGPPQLWGPWVYGGLGGDALGSHVRTACGLGGDVDGDGLCADADLDDDGDGELDGTDCDDGEASVYTGAPETAADGIDQDCNGVDAAMCFQDGDGDGSGATTPIVELDGDCDDDPNDAATGDDCDDGNVHRLPGNPEVCDGFDNDCLGGLPGGEADGDLDRYVVCVAYIAHGAINGNGQPLLGGADCDDVAATVFPGAIEACDGVDSDCDSSLVDGFPDLDNDGAPNCVDPDDDGDGDGDSTDCAAADASIFAGAPEVVGDGIDQDCDGTDAVACFQDGDGDGFGGTTLRIEGDGNCSDDANDAANDDDCDDGAATVFPGAAESCDGLDGDCDGSLVDLFPNLDGDALPDCVDEDDDDDGDPDTSDCADGDVTIFTGSAESCDLLDSDCDGSLVDAFANSDTDGQPDCIDADDDNDSDPDVSDCEDGDPSVYTGAAELCDTIDADCDGSFVDQYVNTDGDSAPDCTDGDDDGDGEPDADDCDPLDATVHTGAVEVPDDGVDQDCSGADLVTCAVDADGDGYGGTATAMGDDGDCVDPGESDNDLDCDDGEEDIHPDVAETCGDGVDQDCDGADGVCGDDDSAGDDDSSGDDDATGDDDTTGDDDSAGDDDTSGDDDSGDDDTSAPAAPRFDPAPGCRVGCESSGPLLSVGPLGLIGLLLARRGRPRRFPVLPVALLWATSTAQAAELVMDPEPIARLAAEVHADNCTDMDRKDFVARNEARVRVAQTMLDVNRSVLAHPGASFLYYWRALLSECYGDTSTLVSDLKTFIRREDGRPAVRALVRDARTRLRRLTGDGRKATEVHVHGAVGGGYERTGRWDFLALAGDLSVGGSAIPLSLLVGVRLGVSGPAKDEAGVVLAVEEGGGRSVYTRAVVGPVVRIPADGPVALQLGALFQLGFDPWRDPAQPVDPGICGLIGASFSPPESPVSVRVTVEPGVLMEHPSIRFGAAFVLGR